MLNGLFAGLLTLVPAGPPPTPAPQVQAPPATASQATLGSQVTLAPPAVRDDLRFRWRDHPQLRAGEWLRVDFLGKFQLDAMRPGDAPSDFDEYEIHRARIGIEGEVFRYFQFSLEREMTEREADVQETQRKPAWKDVYLEANFTDAAQVRVGRFKIPFGLEQNIGIMNLDFVYRSLSANYLAPSRDTGVMVHGRFFDRGLNYWAGVFRQDGDNARSSRIDGADETVAVRVTGLPFRSIAGLAKAEVGGALTVSALDNESVLPNGLRGRTVMSQYVFYEPVFVKGQRRRYEIDAEWSYGPVGARAEYTHVLDTRDGQGLADQDLADARARGWYASGSWLLTGEEKERPVEPKRKLGAVEVVARYERLWFDSAGGEEPALRNPRADKILPSGEHVLSLGVNWYFTKWVKVQLQTLREQPQDPERSPVPGEGAFWSSVFRFQVGI